MADADAETHLKRALELLRRVESETASLRTQIASEPDAGDMPLVAGMLSSFQSGRAIRTRREEMLRDVNLAERELAAVQRDAPGDGRPATLRAGVEAARGTVEMITGNVKAARDHFNRSLAEEEGAGTRYWLGMLNEIEYKPAPALESYEKCLAIEPNGEFSMEALRAADRMRDYKKQFRGSWKTLILWFIFFFPVVPFYWVKNYK